MKYDKLEIIHDKLISRYNGIITDQAERYHATLLQLFNYIDDSEYLAPILVELKNKYKDINDTIPDLFERNARGTYYTTTEKQAAYSMFILEECFKKNKSHLFQDIAYKHGFRGTYVYETLNDFNDQFVKPVIKYLEESLVDGNHILSTLIRYKHKTEWFNNRQLYETWKDNTNTGEKLLTYNLYEYLFDAGIEFTIEPSSLSGRVDLISNQTGKNKLLADAKVFTGSKTNIISGLNQLYTYANDYNQNNGYLVIYKTVETNLQISTENSEQLIPYIHFNNKFLYFIIIDIFQYDKSASERGKMKVVEIKEEEFINRLKEST